MDRVLAELTLDEKIKLLAGKDTWSTFAIERLSIPSITVRTFHHESQVSSSCLIYERDRQPMDPMALEAPLSSMEYAIPRSNVATLAKF